MRTSAGLRREAEPAFSRQPSAKTKHPNLSFQVTRALATARNLFLFLILFCDRRNKSFVTRSVSSLIAVLVLFFIQEQGLLLGSPKNMFPFRLYTLVAGGLSAAFVAYLMFGRKKKTPAEIEHERRDWLNQIGRITDGTVIDVQELVPNGHPAATMLIFQYDVGGVSYEASQDVTYLRQWINLHSCRLGVPTSVRYDPQNPGNSIVVSEKWMGLRQ